MRANRARDTAPERTLRHALRARGHRGYRLNWRGAPGRPDISYPGRRVAVFVHGCFWHGHETCGLARLPRTNHQWWSDKIAANRARDARKEAAMQALGFRVGIVWQCELTDERRATLARRLSAFVKNRKL